jgi:hypothetical protein
MAALEVADRVFGTGRACPVDLLREIDREAKHLGVTRQDSSRSASPTAWSRRGGGRGAGRLPRLAFAPTPHRAGGTTLSNAHTSTVCVPDT